MPDECNFFFSHSPHLPPFLLLLRARGQEALHHPDRRRKRREGERKRDCDGGIKGYPSLSVTSFIVPCSVLPAHPSSAVTHTHTQKYKHTLSTNFHTLNNNKHTSKASTNFDSLSALFHTFTGLTHTHTFTATMTNTQQPEKPHTNVLVGLSAPFHTFSDDTDTQTALQFHTLGGDSRTRQSLGNGDGKHKFACSRARTWAPACQMLFSQS